MTRLDRHSHAHIREELAKRFPGSDVQVDRYQDGGLRIEISTAGEGTIIGISGAEPGSVLAALLGFSGGK